MLVEAGTRNEDFIKTSIRIELVAIFVMASSDASQSIIIPVFGGACAGIIVDISLYPLDTLKTRLQSQYGFRKSGGFGGIYKGIGPTSVGSPVSAAIFFGTYEYVKNLMCTHVPEGYYPAIHMLSATFAEITCCVAKVPVEIIKQRRQASYKNYSSRKILRLALKEEGIRGLYRGYGSTVMRDVPFSVIEFPVWELLKKQWRYKIQRELTAVEVAACGAIAGGVAAAITTPFDVVKTQIMLADSSSHMSTNIFVGMKDIYLQQGFSRLFAGFVPRISMIMLGGAIFFGVYDKSCSLIKNNIG